MDPNATLDQLREAVREFQRVHDETQRDRPLGGADNRLIDLGDTIAFRFQALDSWLSHAGFAPADWR
jgi:hypothetical protein